jgi:hypothetical protein
MDFHSLSIFIHSGLPITDFFKGAFGVTRRGSGSYLHVMWLTLHDYGEEFLEEESLKAKADANTIASHRGTGTVDQKVLFNHTFGSRDEVRCAWEVGNETGSDIE